MPQIATAPSWIPVVAAISGALVGFGASFITAYFNQSKAANESKEQRKREKLESIYVVLINIKSDYQTKVADVINKVHYGKSIEPKSYEAIPPLINLEMLVHLYTPELNGSYLELEKSKDVVGKLYADILMSDFTNKSKDQKQKICGEYVQLTENVLKAVEKMQREIAAIIKA